MGGGDLNLKKSWHPSTLRNLERVWKAEQKHEAEQKKIELFLKEKAEERAREEMRCIAEKSGVIKKKEERLDWMYQGPAAMVDKEDYLLGRTIDKTFEVIQEQENASEDKPSEGFLGDLIKQPSVVSAVSVDMANKLREDPLFSIKKQEYENKKKIINNPIKKKQLQEMLKLTLQDSKKSHKSHKKHKKRRHSSSSSLSPEREHKKKKSNKKHRKSRSPSISPPKHYSRSYNHPDEEKHSRHESTLNHRRSRSPIKKRGRSRSPGISKKNNRRSRSPAISSKNNRRSGSPNSKNHRRSGSPGISSKNHRQSRSRSTSLPKHYSRSYHHTDEERHSRREENYGLIVPKDYKPRDMKAATEYKSAFPRNNGQQRDKTPERKHKLSSEEMARMREEMLNNGKKREDDRSKTVKKYREEVEKEEKIPFEMKPDFIKPLIHKATDSATIADRIKQNVFKIQRHSNAMDQNFARRY